MTAHTPKPWHKPHDDSPHWKSGRSIPVCSKEGFTIAKVGSFRLANVDLITAAPEMLEELTGLVEWYEDNSHLMDVDPDLRSAKAAIAKAKGE